MNDSSGFTLLETIVAIAICGIVLAALASASTSSLRQSREGNFKVQATQILDTVGRRIAGGGDSSLLPGSGETITIDYGELDQLIDISGSREDAYRVRISNDGNMTVGASVTVRYRVEVCYAAGDADRCIRGTTLGRTT